MDPFSKYLLVKAGEDYRDPIILMYHGTAVGSEQQSFQYSIDSRRFGQQLDILKKAGWHTACVKDLEKADELPAKTIILTFDDGFVNNYEGAYLPLLERGMCATWFIVSGCIGLKSGWLTETKNEKMLNQSQLIEMSANGMEIGAHTVNHIDLNLLDENNLDFEIRESKKKLEKIIKQPVVSFAYPYGRFGDLTVNCVKKAGYTFACSVRPGWFSPEADRFRLPRITILSHDSLGVFARKLAFASNDVNWKSIFKYYKERIISKLWDFLKRKLSSH